MTHLTELSEWQALQSHYQTISEHKMQDWFREDPLRFSRFSLETSDILLDYSKNRMTDETRQLLCQLADAANLSAKIRALFSGEAINLTEKRSALHTALRARDTKTLIVNGKNVMPAIHETLQRMHLFSDQVRDQTWRGATDKPIQFIVNIGIGGSHAGPAMATHALKDFASDRLQCFYISNIDSAHIQEVLQQINPETTLFIISSKSFTTLETLTNANTIYAWMKNKIGAKNLSRHFVAVTAAAEKALKFGIPTEQIFPVWEWVGGRYSIWSAIGLPLILMIGMEKFYEFLDGAHEMDQHFQEAEFSLNMPIIMALLGIWYTNFFQAKTQAIIPYTHLLNDFRMYLQQLDMESNGKTITRQGNKIDYATGPIIFGEQGCNGQHAYHQLLHQGQHLVPVDFILVNHKATDFPHHQDALIASALSQAQALLAGKTYEQALKDLIKQGMRELDAKQLAHHRIIPGNRPSNTLFLKRMTPKTLGALLALYEHKIFVQGMLWDINSFDQWGVELGKELLPAIMDDLNSQEMTLQHDASTLGLIQHYKKLKGEV